MSKGIYNILVVDDQNDLREITEEVLRGEGYEVDGAQDGEEAIRKIRSGKYDLVMLDWKIPKIDGIGVLREIRKEFQELYILFFSAVATAEVGKKAIGLGADDCIDKPNDIDDLRKITKKVIKEIDLRLRNRLFLEEDEKRFKIIGKSKELTKSLRLADKVSLTDASVLLRGETGTGKELFARYIHKISARKKKPFIAVNCAAISESLFETEIFGHAKGAFTGAIEEKKGRLELIKGGTLFLDEIGDISLSAQSKLLRVIEEKNFSRLGSNIVLKTDFRLIGATNKNLEEMIEKETLREDFFFRINQFPLFIPPLRERIEDIPILVENFMKRAMVNIKRENVGISDSALSLLRAYKYPGNIRELASMIEHAMILVEGNRINEDDLSFKLTKKKDKKTNMDLNINFQDAKQIFESEYIIFHLTKTKGNISQVAVNTGIDRKQLRKKIKEYNIEVDKYKM